MQQITLHDASEMTEKNAAETSQPALAHQLRAGRVRFGDRALPAPAQATVQTQRMCSACGIPQGNHEQKLPRTYIGAGRHRTSTASSLRVLPMHPQSRAPLSTRYHLASTRSHAYTTVGMVTMLSRGAVDTSCSIAV